MSRKQQPPTINRIDQLNLEIDYDKLAEAIVKAQKNADIVEEKQRRGKTRFRKALFGNINGTVYHGMALLMCALVGGIWVNYANGTTTSLLSSVVFSVLFIIIAFVMFMCGQETFNDNYETTVTLFNTNLSTVALIVAVIALVKELA